VIVTEEPSLNNQFGH